MTQDDKNVKTNKTTIIKPNPKEDKTKTCVQSVKKITPTTPKYI